MPDPSPALIDTIARVLSENGVGGVDASLHSWRCGYPDIYGPCTCTDELVNDLARAALAAMPTPIGYVTMRPGRESIDNECDYIEDVHNFQADAEESAHICRAIYGAGRVVALVPVGDDHA